jgi:hypothetical protein
MPGPDEKSLADFIAQAQTDVPRVPPEPPQRPPDIEPPRPERPITEPPKPIKPEHPEHPIKPSPKLDEGEKAKLELHNKIQDCLKEYKLESNIPPSHDYWNWQNQMRAINAAFALRANY